MQAERKQGMGSCMSRWSKSSSKSSISISSWRRIIRVVHLNGWMEEFEETVTVGQVTSKLPKHFVFKQTSTSQLLIESPPKPMESTAKLEPGNIYFLLPHSIFQMEVSPMDLLTISKRLSTIAAAAAAAASSPKSTKTDENDDDTKQQKQQTKTMAAKFKTNRYAHCSSRYVVSGGRVDHNNNNNINYVDYSTLAMKKKKQVLSDQSSSCNTWKPILESIQET